MLRESGQVLADTDILSAVMRKNPVVISRARAYLTRHKRFAISIITRYEILRGLKAKKTSEQLANFERFCAMNLILPLADDVVVRAAEITCPAPGEDFCGQNAQYVTNPRSYIAV